MSQALPQRPYPSVSRVAQSSTLSARAADLVAAVVIGRMLGHEVRKPALDRLAGDDPFLRDLVANGRAWSRMTPTGAVNYVFDEATFERLSRDPGVQERVGYAGTLLDGRSPYAAAPPAGSVLFDSGDHLGARFSPVLKDCVSPLRTPAALRAANIAAGHVIGLGKQALATVAKRAAGLAAALPENPVKAKAATRSSPHVTASAQYSPDLGTQLRAALAGSAEPGRGARLHRLGLGAIAPAIPTIAPNATLARQEPAKPLQGIAIDFSPSFEIHDAKTLWALERHQAKARDARAITGNVVHHQGRNM